MTKLLVCVLLLGGCAGRPSIVATPEQKAEAVSLYMKGATTSDIGAHYGLDRDEARELLRMSISDLNKKFYGHHQ